MVATLFMIPQQTLQGKSCLPTRLPKLLAFLGGTGLTLSQVANKMVIGELTQVIEIIGIKSRVDPVCPRVSAQQKTGR